MKRLLLAMVLALAVFGEVSALAQSVGPYGPVGGSANVAYTGTAGNTANFQAGPQMVLVYCSTACFVKVGEAVTATTADFPLPANVVTVLRVPPGTGASWRVSAIQASSGGSVFAQPVN
jgi:hypothetical protein